MKKDSTQVVFVLSSILLLAIVMAFTGGLNIVSFEKNYTNTMVSSLAVSGGETVRKIEYAVKYGKPLDNFYGMKELLNSKKSDYEGIEEVYVVKPDGIILYDTQGDGNGRKLPRRLTEKLDLNTYSSSTKYTYNLDGDFYHAFLPIRDNNKNWIGILDMTFDKKIIASQVREYLHALVKYLVIFACIGALALIVIFNRVSFRDNDGTIRKNVLLILLIAVIGTSQIAFGFLNYMLFQKAYIHIAQENASFTSNILKKDIESVVQKGVSADKLYNLEDYLNGVLNVAEDLQAMYVSDADGNIMYSSNSKALRTKALPNSEYTYSTFFKDKQNAKEYHINVEISQEKIKKKMMNILLDMSTVFVTSFFFTIELTLFLIMMLKRKSNKNAVCGAGLNSADPGIARSLSFIVFIALFMPTTFVPIMMKNLYQPIFGLPESCILGLPVSVNFLAGAIALIFAGYIIDSRGWRFTFLIGCLLMGGGALLSGMSFSGIMFIAARLVSGIGYGLTLMSIRGFVIDCKGNKSEGFAGLNAGLNSGINCGVVIGAMLADRISYEYVFFISVGVAAISALFVLLLTRKQKNEPMTLHIKKEKVETKGLIKSFIMDPSVFGLLALIVIPTAICGVFLNYYFPLFAQSIGGSAASVSRAYLLNGICVIGLSSLASRFTAKYFGSKLSLVISCSIIIASLAVFALHGSIITAFIVAIALGIAESFGATAQDTYMLSIKASSNIGEGKALSYVSNAKKIGQTLGPIAFGLVAALGVKGIGVIGILYFMAVIGFYFLSLSDRQKNKKEGAYVQY